MVKFRLCTPTQQQCKDGLYRLKSHFVCLTTVLSLLNIFTMTKKNSVLSYRFIRNIQA